MRATIFRHFILLIFLSTRLIGQDFDVILQKYISHTNDTAYKALPQRVQKSTNSNLQWQNIGPEGGRIETICHLPGARDQLLIGTSNNGLWTSKHDDTGWSQLSTGAYSIDWTADIAVSGDRIYVISSNVLYASHIKDLVFEENLYFSSGLLMGVESPLDNSNIIYLAIYVGHSGDTGIAKSTDGGSSWRFINQGLLSTDATDIKISPHNSQKLLAGTLSGAYINNASGEEPWQHISRELDIRNIYCTEFDKLDSTTIYLGTEKGLFISKNLGADWQLTLNDAPDHNISTIFQTAEGLFFVGTNDGLYRSTDTCQTWKPVNSGLWCRSIETIACMSDSVLLLGTTDGFYVSKNRGDTWQRECNKLHAMTCVAMDLDTSSTPSTPYIGTDGAGVFRKQKNGVWERLNYSSGFAYVKDLRVHYSDSTQLFTSNFEAYSDTTNQASCFLSRINLDSNEQHRTILFEADMSLNQIVIIDDCADTVLVGKQNGLLISYDGCQTWQNNLDGKWIDALAYSPLTGLLYCGTRYRYSDPFIGVYRAPSPYANWQPALDVKNDPKYDNKIEHIYDISINPLNPQTLYMAASDRTWKSTDGGASVYPIRELTGINEYDLSWLPQQTIAVSPVDTSMIVAGGRGCHISYDGGGTWQAFDTDLENLIGLVKELKFDPDAPSTLYAVTTSEGLWRLSIPTKIASEKISKLPDSIALYQNYPNPFNATTILNYKLPMASYVQLEIYNTFGQKVAVLVKANQIAGNYQIEWDGSKHASGLYFCKLKAGHYTNIVRMTLLK